ncbi:MAG: Pantothenate synthetase [candidate division TA06 bacterium 32_111]|uniref:Pantothenate synthetase n=3 Tax=Bacteria candidate phyla TaxID=1783234 RepID=A0A348MJX9_UNCW3|nr:MAG: Pantothenate synthetase [candidate division TA06 bacterium 32_111]HAF07355.1 pantoate--beta-alanine ligase [candidate division WOR-3 bacterium]HCP16491.1 pantoate--beta-alanine ligase [candidate division WOR-3 bacterium]
MKIFTGIESLKKELKNLRKKGRTIGFVPTMGYLHKGHISLIKRAKRDNDTVVASIYVNPLQFGVNEDYGRYPRDLERDKRLLEKNACDILFTPSDKEMYKEQLVSIRIKDLSEKLCGISRPTHFEGVLTVVAKLFNIVTPDRAYFGEKDFQQYLIIKKMVEDLNFNLKVVPCPIVREKDGLAMSSRNTYLSEEQRKRALVLYRSLKVGKEIIEKEGDIRKAKEIVREIIEREKPDKIDYIEIYDEDGLKEINDDTKYCRIFLAVFFGKTRLIDNMRAKLK